MRDENETKIAWDIWTLMVRLSILIWDRYEEEFKAMNLREDKQMAKAKHRDQSKTNSSD